MRLRFGGAVLDLNSRSITRPKTWIIIGVFLLIVYSLVSRFTGSDAEAHAREETLRFKPIDDVIGVHGDVEKAARPLKWPRMAMESARHKMKLISQVQRDVIKNMKRPPDSRYNINVTFSDLLSLDRKLPETRPEVCLSFKYDLRKMPTVTIIVPFYNEALTMLLRTIHSILNRTPDMLLDKIIMVDDKSTDDFLLEPLERYVRLLPKVELIRNVVRQGLILSRMNGARLAESPVIIFLDAHTEANEGWLPPLLEELEKHPSSVIQPFVDGIDTMSLQFMAPETYHVGAFSWDLRYTWMKVPDHVTRHAQETGSPFFTPTLVGCALVVRKDYFFGLGAFDEGLRIWGGENIELAWRVWMCGGRVVTVTCSRLGHVFKNFPYKFDGNKEDTVQKNLIRVAETWMGPMRKYFYAATRIFPFKRTELTAEEQASLDERIALRDRLKCRNFDWYMHNVIPEVGVPPMDAVYYGEIMNLKTRACWEVLDDYMVGMNYLCYEHKIIPKNNMALTREGLLRYRGKCVAILPPKPYMVLLECPDAAPDALDRFGRWRVKGDGETWGHLVVERVNDAGKKEWYCVTQVTNVLEPHHREQMPQIGPCDDNNEYQNWAFSYRFDFSQVPPHALT